MILWWVFSRLWWVWLKKLQTILLVKLKTCCLWFIGILSFKCSFQNFSSQTYSFQRMISQQRSLYQISLTNSTVKATVQIKLIVNGISVNQKEFFWKINWIYLPKPVEYSPNSSHYKTKRCHPLIGPVIS